MIFFPLYQMMYSDEQRMQAIQSHNDFIGDEEAVTIAGIQDLFTIITFRKGLKCLIRSLFLSLPSSAGSSKPNLFQRMERQPTGPFILAVF
jgi:hypothetical protein